MKQNILYTVVLSSIFILLEIFFRLTHSSLENMAKISNYFEIFLVLFALSFVPKKIATIFIGFLSSIFIIEILHYNYFGYFLFPMEFILFFTKFHEILETGSTVLHVLIAPIIFSIVLFCTIFYTNKLTQERLIFNKTKYLLFMIIIFPIINTTIHYEKRGLGDRPNTNKSIIKNGLYVTKTFLGKTLPLTLLDIQTVPTYKNDLFKANQNNKISNVILIIGESLSIHHMSLYDYPINTTPLLVKLQKNNKNLIALRVLSAGVFTDISIPMILNIEKRPNAVTHILSNETNLFKLAKDNHYNTYFISAQSNDGFSYIRSYMGIKYIDHYIDSSNYGYDKYTSTLDNILVKEFTKIDFTKSNFIVLNMIGSHSPYKTRVPQNFRPFKANSTLHNYDNTVSYTDMIVASIINKIKEKKKKVLLVFTSDHGESISKNGCGHGNIKNHFHYQVPAIIYTHKFTLNNDVLQKLQSTQFTSHYNLSLLIGHYLGYKTLHNLDTTKAYIDGNELSGNGGYLEYNLQKNNFLLK
jgi:glucan phosphoethanolaminetransferase (alkaline phosphatase superfamily)